MNFPEYPKGAIILIFGVSILLALLFFTTKVDADQHCNETKKIVEHLYKNFGEVPLWSGLVSSSELITIFGNPDGTSWTRVISSLQRKESCIIGSGTASRVHPAKEAKEKGQPIG